MKKCDNIKFEKVQLQNKHAPFKVRDAHHEDVTSMSNLEMTLEAILHHLCSLKPIKHGHMGRHNFKERKKKFNQNQISNECVEDLLHQIAWL